MKKIVASCLILTFITNQLFLSVLAADINVGGPFPTDTTISNNGNITDIFTNTTVNSGQIGINSFDRFNVDQGDIVNLQLIGGQNKLVNLIFDDSASQINGVVNSYMNGQIGGNILFANPNGFVIGENGVFNVGSLTMMTPTIDKMNDLIQSGIISGKSWNEAKINGLISFSFDENDYFIAGTKDDTYILASSDIVINGKINSANGIDLLAGSSIDINSGAELNANMDFAVNGNDVVASKKAGVSANTKTTVNDVSTYKTAMQDGNGIIIVAQNKGTEHKDYLSAIVNLNGKVDANNGDVIAQSEIYKANKSENVSVSQINVNQNADISGKDVSLKAKANITSTDQSLVDFSDISSWLDWLLASELSFLANDFVHLANVKTQVTVDNGAVINAINNLVLEAKSYLPITVYSVMQTLAFSYLDFDFTTESVIRNGADITAKNLDVNATTDIRTSTMVTATNLLETLPDLIGTHIMGHGGAYALNFSVIDVVNRAVIEQGSKLAIQDNIDVIATVLNNRDISVATGILPVVDPNRGPAGIALSVVDSNVTNEAIMNADVEIDKNLNVVADYYGYLRTYLSGASASSGENGEYGAAGRMVKSVLRKFKLLGGSSTDDIITRATGSFDDIKIAAALGLNIDNVSSVAKIGDASNSVKPNIQASSVNVGGTVNDSQSFLTVASSALEAKNSVSGAIGVNMKDYNSQADVYGNLTLSGGDTGNALIILSNTNIEHPAGIKQQLSSFLEGIKDLFRTPPKTEKNVISNVDSNNASDYIASIGEAQYLDKTIKDAGSLTSIFSAFDLSAPVIGGLCNTYVTSAAGASAVSDSTNAYAGAVGVAIFETTSNAELLSGSSVTLIGGDSAKNNILIQANTNNEMWSIATLTSLFNAANLLAGMTARDGDSVGGAVSVQYADVDTIARIGENVKIKTSGSGKEGDLSVLAKETGNYVNLAIGSGNADESGLAGGVALTFLNGGETKASIEKSTEEKSINSKNLNVKASKDDEFINSVIAYASSQNSKGFGISGIVLYDAVEAYIAGNVKTTGNVLLDALYDKLFVNSVLNVGVATQGTDAPRGKLSEPEDAEDFLGLALNDLFAQNIEEKTEAIQNLYNAGYDFTRAINPDKQTSAYAGSITSNVAINDVKAYIADGANIDSDGNISINAMSNDKMVNVASAIAANGKSGGGASITANLTKNDVEAYIGNATVDAGSNLNVKAQENFSLVAVSAGIAQAKDSTGAGNVSMDVQVNNVTSAIKNGAKINTKKDKSTQNVLVEAIMNSSLVKGIGAAAIQFGGSAGASGGAIGATIDGDVVINTINAYIDGAEINSANDVKVSAINSTNLIMADVAGAISTQNSAYGGTIGAYVSVSEENAYIKDSKINTNDARLNKGKNVEVKAENAFDEVVIVGTATGGNSTSAGASVRTDVISDKINSYIVGSTINNSNDSTLINNSELSSIAVTVAGSLSTTENAGSGTAMVLSDVTQQRNYIDNSVVNSGSVTLDSDKTLDTLGVVGAISASLNKTSIGLSTYAIGTNHIIDTFIKNSDIISNADINLTSDYTQDILSIVFGGSGGTEIAGSGAVNTIVNNSKVNTYILAEETSTKKNLSANGKLKVKSQSDIDTKVIDGNASLSMNNVSAGAAINTYLNNASIKAGIDGADIKVKNGVDVLAKSEQKQKSFVVGAGGGNSTAVEGSINAIDVNQILDAYIKNATIKSGDDVDVKTEDMFDFSVVIGAIIASMGGSAVGASVLTALLGGENKAYIENSSFDNFDNSFTLKNLIVESKQNDKFSDGIVAGAAGNSNAVGGTVSTIRLNKKVSAYTDNVNNENESKFQNVTVNSIANTDLDIIAGALAGGGTTGVGATVNTITLDKQIKAFVKNSSNLKADNKITVLADVIDDINIASVAGSGGGSYAVSGIISTTHVDSKITSSIKDSTISTNEIDIDAKAKNTFGDESGAISGAGTVGVGGTVVTNAISYNIKSFIENIIVSEFNIMDVKADANTNFNTYSISGAGSGSAAVAGVGEINLVNNDITSYVNGNVEGKDGSSLNVNATDTVNFNGKAGSLAGGGVAGVGTTVATNKVTSTVLAYLGSAENKQIDVDNIKVGAYGVQKFNDLLAVGFGGGQGAGTATALVNIVDATIKAYINDESKIVANSLDVNASDIVTITEDIVGGAGALYVALGSSVGVNTITNMVEAYTGDDVILNVENTNIEAISTTNLGSKDDKLLVVAASGAAGALAGAVLKNSIENEVYSYIGKNNEVTSAGDLNVDAKANTNIYETVGEGSGGIVGIGASVGVNTIDNSVNAFVGEDSIININGDLSVSALSNEIVDASAVVVGGAGIALNGGIIHNTIGKNQNNESVLSGEDASVYNTALSQANDVVTSSIKEQENANKNYKAYSGIETDTSFSLFTKSENSGSDLGTSAILNTTSVFIGSEVEINASSLKLLSQNTDNIKINVDGVSIGGVAVGVASGVSNVYTNTKAKVSSATKINVLDNIDINANSIDTQNIDILSATGGVVNGSGGIAHVNSNKITNTSVLASAILNATNDLNIQANSIGSADVKADGHGYAGLTVGVMKSKALISGSTNVDIEEGVNLKSEKGGVLVETFATENAKADANALTGNLIGGIGAEVKAQSGKNTTINIGKNIGILAKLSAIISSKGKNEAIAISNGRAYGGISVGGTSTEALINSNGGVTIADADLGLNKTISGGNIEITSIVENNVEARTNAGAGAIIGIDGSCVYSNINSINDVLIGKNYELTTSDGVTFIGANSINTYKSYNDSSAYGVAGITAGKIRNNINSEVQVVSESDIISNGVINFMAMNEVKKAIVNGYDLLGGAGGVVGVGSASIIDNIKMLTTATLGGNKVYSTGDFDNGSIAIASQSLLDVNEKVSVVSGGVVPVVDGDVKVYSDVVTKTNVKTKEIKTKEDDIFFIANNDINIYTKSDVHSYGGVAVADGESIAKNNNAIASVILSSGVNSLSAKDTYIQALCDKSIQALMYATTHGLIGKVGNSSATAYNNSIAEIIIESDAYLKSLDTMNLTASDNLQNFNAIREAKGTTRAAFGIPIIIYGEGHQYTTNTSNSLITLNGTIESGAGSVRDLTINKDGTYTSNGINVIGKEKVGEISSEEIQADIDALKNTKENKIGEIDDYISIENSIITNAQTAINNTNSQKNLLTAENLKYSEAISNANKIIENNDLIALNQGNVEYVSQLESENLTLSTVIKEINPQIDCSDNSELASFITTINNTIEQNSQEIVTCDNAITALNSEIAKAQSEINEAGIRKSEIVAYYDNQISDLEDLKTASANSVYSLLIDDIIINSGNAIIRGNVVGNGTIKTSGNGFSINIVNNSINDIVYGDIKIDRGSAGLIIGGTIASTINQIIGDSNQGCNITILNTIDANDSTVDFNNQNGYGDMVFLGDIENVNGNVEITNNTGNVLTIGFISAKNLKITVPNGSYSQKYSNESLNVGGATMADAIIASGDINIASKVIDINGLIQSGSEIKSINIPEFKVVKEGDKYYQVIGNSKLEMEKSSTDDSYLIHLGGNGQGDSALELIKAYFKLSDESDLNNIKGDIYLSKTDIQGGNITLTGNIISTSNKGKIVLVNGYGHIDINNNSNFNLVANAISAEDKINSKLTINDFKLYDNDKAGSAFDNLTQENVEDPNWLSLNSGTYIASVDENGNVVTSSTGLVDANGSWGATSSFTREDGANISSVIYTPGSDAYYVSQTGSSETKSYVEYVKRSWWTEFLHGKLYRTVYYNVNNDPVYDVAQNEITVQFQGFDKPQINVNSNSSIIMNNSIGAINGDVNINSSNGSITTSSINNLISAENINLSAKEDIGSELKPIQTAIYNNGELSTNSNNVYINYPYTDISNIIINAIGNAYLATSGTMLSGLDNEINIKADSLELIASKGSILWDMSKDNKINIDVNKLKARANWDISLINDGDLNISNLSANGNISLESKNGSIKAVSTDSVNPYNIDSENVILKALNGYIGTENENIKIARDGIINVSANGDINLYSAGRIYADLITSEVGKVNLNADYGIIETEIRNNLVYNIYAKEGVNLSTKFGNIENIVINTDGTINAIAGYSEDAVSGVSDISIGLISKKELSQEYLESLTNDTDRQTAFDNYQVGLKDMKLGTIKASKNVFIHSEKSILNADNNSSVSGSLVVLSTANGNIGQSDSAVKIDAKRELTAFAKKDGEVYLTSDNNLNINEIRSVNEFDNNSEQVRSDNVLNNVVISTKGNITNSALEIKSNIVANNINLSAGKDIGSSTKYFNVSTVSNIADQGLQVSAINAYINGYGSDLNVVGAEVNNSLNVSSPTNTNIVGNINANNVIINSNNTTTIGSSIINATLNNTSNNLLVNNAVINGDLNANSPTIEITEMNLSGNINAQVDDLKIATTNNLNIGNIVGNTKDYTSNVDIRTEKSMYNGLLDDGINIYVKDLKLKAGKSIGTEVKPLNIKLVDGNTVSLEAGEVISVNTSGAAANYTNIDAEDFYLYTNEDVIIDILRGRNVKIQTTSHNMSINDMYILNRADLITRDKNIVVSNSSLMPVIDADVQLYVSQHPASLRVNRSNNVSTPAKNVVRFNDRLLINRKNVDVSMEKTINTVTASAENNTNVSKKVVNRTDSLLYQIPTKKTYYEDVKTRIGQGIIKNHIDEYITEFNVMDVINISKNKNSKIEYLPIMSYSKTEYKKVSSL